MAERTCYKVYDVFMQELDAYLAAEMMQSIKVSADSIWTRIRKLYNSQQKLVWRN